MGRPLPRARGRSPSRRPAPSSEQIGFARFRTALGTRRINNPADHLAISSRGPPRGVLTIGSADRSPGRSLSQNSSDIPRAPTIRGLEDGNAPAGHRRRRVAGWLMISEGSEENGRAAMKVTTIGRDLTKSIFQAPGVKPSLVNPVRDRLDGLLERAPPFFGRSPGAVQPHHLAAELRRMGGSDCWHRGRRLRKLQGVHRTGSTPQLPRTLIRTGRFFGLGLSAKFPGGIARGGRGVDEPVS